MLRRSVVLVAAGCLALAGCGSSGPDSSAANLRPDPGIEDTAAEAGFTDKSADEIVAAAFADMRTLTSVHAKGTVTAEGEGEIGLDLTVAEDACDGTLTFNGAEASIRRVDGTTYLKGGRDLWETFDGEQGSVVAAVVGDRWLDLGDSGSEFDEFCLIEELFYPLRTRRTRRRRRAMSPKSTAKRPSRLRVRARTDRPLPCGSQPLRSTFCCVWR